MACVEIRKGDPCGGVAGAVVFCHHKGRGGGGTGIEQVGLHQEHDLMALFAFVGVNIFKDTKLPRDLRAGADFFVQFPDNSLRRRFTKFYGPIQGAPALDRAIIAGNSADQDVAVLLDDADRLGPDGR